MNGKVIATNNQGVMVQVNGWTAALANEWLNREVDIDLVRPHRTLSQNALYWKFCEYCGKQLQLTPEQLHEYLKYNILPEIKVVDMPTGQITIRTCGSTKYLHSAEFSQYMDECNAMMIDMGVDTSGFFERGK